MNNNKKLILSTIAISGWVLAAYIIVNYYLQFVEGAVMNSIANEGIRENGQGDYLQSNNLIAKNDDYTAYYYALAAQSIAELEG